MQRYSQDHSACRAPNGSYTRKAGTDYSGSEASANDPCLVVARGNFQSWNEERRREVRRDVPPRAAQEPKPRDHRSDRLLGRPSRRPRKAPSRGDEAAPGNPWVAPLRQRFRAKRPTRGVGTLAGAVAIPRGAAGLNRRGLRTPRPKLCTGQPHARHPWRGAPVVYARGTASDARRIAEFTWCPASPPDSPRGQWCCSPERPADGRWGAGSRLVWRGLRPSPR